jgi:WD40 repeat protein
MSQLWKKQFFHPPSVTKTNDGGIMSLMTLWIPHLSVAFSSDGTRIVFGSEDRSVRVWDASTGAELKILNGHTGWVRSVAFSSDGTGMASGSDDRWDQRLPLNDIGL